MNTIIFDLDGTISDPAEGITRSINYALEKLGVEIRPEKDLLKYIGPPLKVTFGELAGIDQEEQFARAVELYRERYIKKGFSENRMYDGMEDVLQKLAQEGNQMCIATTKRVDMAFQVLDYFDIRHYFKKVLGCDIHRQKADLLSEILADPETGSGPAVMIGDRDTDFIAASRAGIPSIAVRWGYGNTEEFSLAAQVADKPSDLPEMIKKILGNKAQSL